MLGLLLFVLSALWSGTGLDETAWAGGEGEEALLKEEGRKEGLFNRSLSKLQGCCSLLKRDPKEESGKLCISTSSRAWRVNEPTAPGGQRGTCPPLI